MLLQTRNNSTSLLQIPDSWRILITGITSIHGWPVYSEFRKLLPASSLFGVRPPKTNYPLAANVMSACITNQEKLEEIRDSFKPTHVIHCAGVCDLNVCEERPEWAHSINVQGAKTVRDVFGNDVPVLFMSTDLVFSGRNPPVGGYTEDAPLSPISVAGKTFALAEKHIQECREYCITRIALPLGGSIKGDKGAIDWIEGRFKRNLPVTLFYDEFRSCVNCNEIATMVARILILKLNGLFHFGGDKRWSLYDIGEHVLEKGEYSASLLKGRMIHEEENGPPRVGDVSLNSSRLRDIIKI